MKNNNLILGIDTSNYTTSVALTQEDGTLLKDLRKLLQVKQGERGLRQSHALFQHMENLPTMLEEILNSPFKKNLKAVSVSTRPRPIEGSYMPVFNVGARFASVVAASLELPLFSFSHQEGHMAAGKYKTVLEAQRSFLAWHLSGGTCELLRVSDSGISILGGSKDISFGQLIDRVGVAMGLSFPCGKALSKLASATDLGGEAMCSRAALLANPLKSVPLDALRFNVSGIETQALRSLGQMGDSELVFFLFQRIGECLAHITREACTKEKETQVLFTGGVAASGFLRTFLSVALRKDGLYPVFGEADLSSDNAVGISLLGGQALWH